MLPCLEDEVFVCLVDVAFVLHSLDQLCGAMSSVPLFCMALLLQWGRVHAAWSLCCRASDVAILHRLLVMRLWCMQVAGPFPCCRECNQR